MTGGRDIEIPGATGASYRPAAGDGASRLKVRVSFTDGTGNRETLVSEATRVVLLPPALGGRRRRLRRTSTTTA